MKNAVLISTLCFLLLSSSVWAIIDDGVNSLGVYFDPPVYEQTCNNYASFVPSSMYFVLANCSEPTIGLFEFRWSFDPDPAGLYLILSTIFPPGAINFGSQFNFYVGLGTPMMTEEATILVEIQIMYLAPGLEAQIMAGPAMPPTVPGWPLFSDGENMELYAMTYSTYDPVNGNDIDPVTEMISIGTLGCPGPVATNEQSFDSVKALYR